MGLKKWAHLWALLLLCGIQASPLVKTCSHQCSQIGSVLFEPSKTYSYRVRISNRAHADLHSADAKIRENLLEIESLATLATTGQACDLTLTLHSIKLHFDTSNEEIAEANQFVEQLSTPIVFAYRDGKVIDVCPSQFERQDSYSLSVKKSIISALQTIPVGNPRVDSFEILETDVNGECNTRYQVQQYLDKNQILIKKEKNLDSCKSLLDNEKLLKITTTTTGGSVARCEQLIEEKLMKWIRCETSRKVPTLSHLNVRVDSTVEVVFDSVRDGIDHVEDSKESTYLPHPHHLMASPLINKPKAVGGGDGKLASILSKICKDIKSKGRVSWKTPYRARQLARAMQRSTREEVLQVWQHIDETVCGEDIHKLKDIFVDTCAAEMGSTSGPIALEQLKKLLQEDQLERARTLAAKISFATNPSSELVDKHLPKVLREIQDSQIILSLTSLAKKTVISERTGKILYKYIMLHVNEKLLNQRPEPSQEADIVRLFAALENLSIEPPESIRPTVAKIFAQKKHPAFVRITAMKSLKNVPIQTPIREALLQMFQDSAEENDIRIFAYQTLVHSRSSTEDLTLILQIIQKEQESNQDLYNFVCSHQQNLRSEKFSLPVDAPAFPQPLPFTQAFVSRNYDWSYVDPKTSIGVSVKGDVIMPRESRIPQTISLNLTLPVADSQVQLVEVVARQEGLGNSLLGFMDQIQKMTTNPGKIFEKLNRLVKSEQRRRPSIRLQVLFNIDGKNIFVWDSAEKSPANMWNEILKQVPAQLDETSLVMPFKHRVPIPTASGIPVMFELNNTYIFSLESQISGEKQAWEMMLKPTFIAEMSVGLEADVGFEINTTKQVHFVSQFEVSPTLHLKAEKVAQKKVKLQILLPEQEQTFAKFETRFYKGNEFSKSQRGKNLVEPTNGVREDCLNGLETLTGLSLCHQQFRIENLRQVLQSDSVEKVLYKSELKLIKRDAQIEGVEIEVQLPERGSEKLEFSFTFRAPPSIQHQFAVNLIGKDQNDSLSLEIEVKNGLTNRHYGTLSFVNRDAEKAIKFRWLGNGKNSAFELESHAKIVRENNSDARMNFGFRLLSPHSPRILSAEANFNLKQNKKTLEFQVDLDKNNLAQFHLIEQGDLFHSDKCKLSADFRIDLLDLRIASQASVLKEGGSVKSTGHIKYSLWSRRDEIGQYKFDYQSQNRKQIVVHGSLELSEFPQLNSELHYNLKALENQTLNQELMFTWASRNKIRIYHQNNHQPEMRDEHLVQVDLDPFDLHYGVKYIRDLSAGTKVRQTLTLQDISKRQTLFDGNLFHEMKPFAYNISGDVKLLDSKYALVFSDTLNRKSKSYEWYGKFALKNQTEIPETWLIPRSIQYGYTWRAESSVREFWHTLRGSMEMNFGTLASFEHSKRNLDSSLIGLESPWITVGIEFDQLAVILDKFLLKDIEESSGVLQAEVKLILLDFEQLTLMRVGPKDLFQLETEFRSKDRNWLKCIVDYRRDKFQSQLQYRNSWSASWQFTRGETCRMDGMIRSEQAQHQLGAEWIRCEQDWCLRKAEVKNQFADKSLLDLYYKREKKETEVSHKLVASTRLTHLEVICTGSGTRRSRTAVWLFNSKRFGGIQHKTRMERTNDGWIRIRSSTIQNQKPLCELEASLSWNKESKVKVDLAGKQRVDLQLSKLNSQLIRGQMEIKNIDSEESLQNFEFELDKPKYRFQMNIFNPTGRQVDVNIDLGKALQRKLQMVSFVDSIPSIDIESAFGENSRIVAAVNFREEKMQISFNWFGQWRRDFRFQALFKCHSSSDFELMVSSKHPERNDQIDAEVKVHGKQYSLNWKREFQDNSPDWNASTILEVDGEKRLDLQVQRSEVVQNEAERIIRLDVRSKGIGVVEMQVYLQEDVPKKVTLECNSEYWPVLRSELFLFYRESPKSPEKTGIEIASGNEYFQAHYMQDKSKGSKFHLNLPTGIEYTLDIQANTNRMELEIKRKNQSESIYKIWVKLFNEQKDRVARIEVQSSRFVIPGVKIIEVRYNLDSDKCRGEETEYHWPESCFTGSVVAGSDREPKVKFDLEYAHYVEGRDWNRTTRFTVATFPKGQERVNFDLTGHQSGHSVGLNWKNFHLKKFGLLHLSAIDTVDAVVKCGNKQEEQLPTIFGIHFDPKRFWNTLELDLDDKTQWSLPQQFQQLASEIQVENFEKELQQEAERVGRFGADLFGPAWKEVGEVIDRLEVKGERAAQSVSRFADTAADKLTKLVDSSEKWIEKVISEVNEAYRNFFEWLLIEAKSKCDSSVVCRKILNQIYDYEVNRYLQEKVVKRMEDVYESHKQYIPQPLLDLLSELAGHRSVEKSFGHLLKLSQPESNLIGRIPEQSSPKPEQQQQPQGYNWQQFVSGPKWTEFPFYPTKRSPIALD